MIDDQELRELYAGECEEHLLALDEGLLCLEKTPSDAATLEALFRAAHSLKGSSRMVGVAGAESVAHAMEEILGHAKRGRRALLPHDLQRLDIGLNALRVLVAEAVTGAPANLNITKTLNEILATETISTAFAPTSSTQFSTQSSTRCETEAVPANANANANANELSHLQEQVSTETATVATTETATLITATETALNTTETAALFAPTETTAQKIASSEIASSEIASSEIVSQEIVSSEIVSQDNRFSTPVLAEDNFKIQTMRVPPARLDALMTMASELAVTTTRVSRGLSSLDEIGALCERWSRDIAQRQRSMARAAKLDQSAISPREKAALREEAKRLASLQELWTSFRAVVPKNAARLNAVAEDIEESVRNVRLLPLSTVFNFFPRLVRDIARAQNKDVYFVIEGGDTPADKRVLEEIKDPLMHMLRNAIDHGIETPDERVQISKPPTATLRLRAERGAAGLTIEISDDGRGLDEASIARVAVKRGLHTIEEIENMSRDQVQMLIFAPGFSTSAIVTDVSGRGVGMDVVRHNVENLKGTLSTFSQPNHGCTFTIRLPLTLATTRVLLVQSASQTFALPVESVHALVRLRREQLFSSEGRPAWIYNDEAISLVPLSQLLELPPQPPTSSTRTLRSESPSSQNIAICGVILEVGGEKIGVQVDDFLDEQEVVFKSLGALLRRVRNVAGTTILGTGAVCLVLNAHDLLRSSRRQNSARALLDNVKSHDEKSRGEKMLDLQNAPSPKTILLVEDSIVTRTQEKRILESAGYHVVTAVDGVDGLAKLATRAFDAVVSDVEMPNLNGLSMAEKIRQNTSLREMPIILVTSLASDEDKRRGVEVGANAYITKGTFDQKSLLDALSRLL